MSDSDRMPLEDGSQKRRLVRFDPRVGIGEAVQLILLITMGLAGYGGITSWLASEAAARTQIRIDLDAEKVLNKERYDKFESQLDRLTQAAEATNVNVAILKERSDREAHK
jgi:hypothetical protein